MESVRDYRASMPASALFCIACGQTACSHLKTRRGRFTLTSREVDILRAILAVDSGKTLLVIGRTVGFSKGTLKVYLARIYEKFGWKEPGTNRHSLRLLVLWAVANHERLGLVLPLPQQFDFLRRSVGTLPEPVEDSHFR